MTGARRDWLVSNAFVMIHLDLIDEGLSWEAAGLLHRIHFRAGGDGWWYTTKEDMQADTRLTEWKLRKAIEELREHEMIEWERQSATNPTLRWRVLFADDPDGGRPHSRDGGKLTQESEEPSFSSTKNVKNKDSSSSGDDGGSGAPAPELGGEAVSTDDELFEDFWHHYPKKVSRKDARTAFGKALKLTDYLTLQTGLVSAIKAWRTDGKVIVEGSGETLKVKVAPGEAGKGVPHAATWLNGERWNDEYPDAKAAAGESGEDPNAWMHRTE